MVYLSLAKVYLVMDRNITQVIIKLKVLSKIQSGQKIMVDDSKIVIMECQKNKWDRFVKWWQGETRQKTIEKLCHFYAELEQMLDQLVEKYLSSDTSNRKESNSRDILIRLVDEMKKSLDGVGNLIETYSKDQTTVAELETWVENIQLKIEKISQVVNYQPAVRLRDSFEFDNTSSNGVGFDYI